MYNYYIESALNNSKNSNKRINHFMWKYSKLFLKKYKRLLSRDSLLLDTHLNRSGDTTLPFNIFSVNNGNTSYMRLYDWCFEINCFDGFNIKGEKLDLTNECITDIRLKSLTWKWYVPHFGYPQQSDLFRFCIGNICKCDCGDDSCKIIKFDIFTLIHSSILNSITLKWSFEHLRTIFAGKISIDDDLYLIRAMYTLELDTSTGMLSSLRGVSGEIDDLGVSVYRDTGVDYDMLVRSLVFGG